MIDARLLPLPIEPRAAECVEGRDDPEPSDAAMACSAEALDCVLSCWRIE